MKRVKTPAEREAHEAEKKLKRNHKSALIKAKNIMKNLCLKNGLLVAEMQLNYCRRNMTKLPKIMHLSINEIISSYEDGIKEYKQSLED